MTYDANDPNMAIFNGMHNIDTKTATKEYFKRQDPFIFYKTIYNYGQKTKQQLADILDSEVETIKRNNAGYVLAFISKPKYFDDGSIEFTIHFKKG